MLDVKTGRAVVVCVDLQYGPFIKIAKCQDPTEFERILNEEQYVLYLKGRPGGVENEEWHEYFFGEIADAVKLQSIVDSID
ncbi:hypothetical protein [Pseudomonas putida]